MSESDHKELIESITRVLDQSIENLDSEISTRLGKIRFNALQKYNQAAQPEEYSDPLVLAAKVALDDEETELDPAINNRLDQIRLAAMAKAEAQHKNSSPTTSTGFFERFKSLFDNRLVAPAGAFATVCVLITGISLFYLSPGSSQLTDEDVLLFASAEEMELYENLDFYLWLTENGLPDQ